jgi:hypothetical protein
VANARTRKYFTITANPRSARNNGVRREPRSVADVDIVFDDCKRVDPNTLAYLCVRANNCAGINLCAHEIFSRPELMLFPKKVISFHIAKVARPQQGSPSWGGEQKRKSRRLLKSNIKKA